MYTVKKIQLLKALDDKTLDRHEASFIISLLNESTDLNEVIKNMCKFSLNDENVDFFMSPEYTLREHTDLSSIIINKISSISITQEELEAGL